MRDILDLTKPQDKKPWGARNPGKVMLLMLLAAALFALAMMYFSPGPNSPFYG